MLAHLMKIKFPLRAKKPIYSIGQTLNVLVKAGAIKLARKGGGSTPNLYRAKTPKTEALHLAGAGGIPELEEKQD